MPEPTVPAEGGFHRRAVLIVSAVAGVLAALSLYLVVQGSGSEGTRARATTSISYSALGFRAFAELLRDLDYSVIPQKASGFTGDDRVDLAVVAAPRGSDELKKALARYVDVPAVLVVAPKYIEVLAPEPNHAVRYARLLPRTTVARIVSGARSGISFRRPAALPGSPAANLLGTMPSSEVPQLVSVPGLRTIVGYGAVGSMVVELQPRNPRIWLLSDPELLANYGLGDGDNAPFAIGLVERLAAGGRRVVFEEAMNVGGPGGPGFWARLFSRPWVAVTIAVAALVVGIGFAAAWRFGGTRAARQRVAAGRASLIAATAKLQVRRDHGVAALQRFLSRVLRQVGARRHAPNLADAELARWFAAAEDHKGVSERAVDLYRRVMSATGSRARQKDIEVLAARIHRWRLEMLDERN